MHRLSEFAQVAGLAIIRDGTFLVTGKLSTPLEGLCVPLRSAAYVEAVNSLERAAAVITTAELAPLIHPRLAVAVSARPDDAHAELHAAIAVRREGELRSRVNEIASTAEVDSRASIAPYGVTIGPGSKIGPFVAIYPGVTIESESIIHAGCVLGSPGFNVGKMGGRQRIVPQLGGVRIKSHVEILANVTIARAIFGGDTTIGEEAMIDNLTYIAHDAQIGARVQICAMVNILGRVIIGEDAYIGPSSVIINGARVGPNARVSMGAVVTRDVPEGGRVTGNFAIDHQRFLSHIKAIR